MAETKECEACGQVIGASEKVCPKCEVDFEELDAAVNVVELATKVAQKRKVQAAPLDPPEPAAPTATPPRKRFFDSLGKAITKKKD